MEQDGLSGQYRLGMHLYELGALALARNQLRHAAVGQEALDVVEAVRAGLDLDEATERAPLDPLGGEPIGLRIRGRDRQR